MFYIGDGQVNNIKISRVTDTLNIFDYTEARTPILIVEIRNDEESGQAEVPGS